MGFANNYRGHKANYICPIDGCKYHSRIFVSKVEDADNKHHNHSKSCPKHRKRLIYVNGNLLKSNTNVGKKARKNLLNIKN